MSGHKVAVLMGGRSSEHDISMKTGGQVVDALPGAVSVVIDKAGDWVFDGDRTTSLGAAIDRLKATADVVFVALHGPFGEDGTVQGLLDAAGIPYTGSGVLGSALAMDKVRSKRVYESVGLPTPTYVAIDRWDWAHSKASLLESVPVPCVLKPAASGSSVGVSFSDEVGDAETKIDALLADVELVLAEARIDGAEFSCGVLSVDSESKLFALPVIEIIPDRSKYAYFDYEAKYTPGATQEITPARIDEVLTKRIQDLAVAAHRALGCRDFSRTDFLLDAAGAPTLLETNTIPGLTAESLLPKSAKAAGIEFSKLVSILVDNASRRGPARFY